MSITMDPNTDFGPSPSDNILTSFFQQPTTGSVPPPNGAAKTVGWVLSGVEIAGITILAVVVCLAVVAIVFLVSRRKSKRRSHYNAVNSLEKGGDASRHEVYLKHRRSSSENGGNAPLLETKTMRSTAQSWDESDIHYSKDDSPSTFVNGEESTRVKQAPVDSVAYSTLSAKPETELETATFIPSRSPSPRSTNSPPKLLPLSIPVFVPAVRQPSKGKRTKRSSKHASKIMDAGVESDDSDSMYSQASGSTHHSKASTGTTQSSIQAYPLPPVPIIPQHLRSDSLPLSELSNSTRRASAASDETIRPSPVTPLFTPLPPIVFDRTEDEAEVNRADTIVISKLLKSRVKQTPMPLSRSFSDASHIERSGSIKTAGIIADEDGTRSYGSRYMRLKHGQDTRHSRSDSNPPGIDFRESMASTLLRQSMAQSQTPQSSQAAQP
ncbi:hypothetical protein B0H34DRAFT_386980 [Crassisporium funariophilum]|nr:hypothetical protein B0H34DRAFT_386980 [Crassisporium funariophilum]